MLICHASSANQTIRWGLMANGLGVVLQTAGRFITMRGAAARPELQPPSNVSFTPPSFALQRTML
jgi:hypothetical protein